MTAVAVWNYQPDVHELLQKRVQNGWRPTASRLQAGDQVLGNAVCLFGGEEQTK